MCASNTSRNKDSGGRIDGTITPLVAAAHELKSPLVLIRQLVLSLENQGLADSTLEKIRLTSEKALRLTSDLTRSARLDDALFNLEPINPEQVCRDIVAELNPLFKAKHRDIKIYASRKRDPLLLIANRDLLFRIVSNLTENALHYAEDETIVTISITKRKRGSKYSASMIQIDNTSTSWTTGTTISANITYSTPTAGASLASNIITTTNAGSTAITFTGTGTLDKTVFVKLTEVDGSNNPVSDSAYTKALGAYTTVGSYTLNSPVNGAVNYLVIAGGGGGDFNGSGGGGAGGYRTTVGTSGGGASAETVLNLASSTAYSVVVGAGGGVAINGSNSSLATIASIGGGAGINGGSGNSGGSGPGTGGSGGGGTGGVASSTAGVSGLNGKGGGGGGGSAYLSSGAGGSGIVIFRTT